MDDVPALRYTRDVIAESMRLYPPAWVVGRRAVEDAPLGEWTAQGLDRDHEPVDHHRAPATGASPKPSGPSAGRTARRRPAEVRLLPFGGGTGSASARPSPGPNSSWSSPRSPAAGPSRPHRPRIPHPQPRSPPPAARLRCHPSLSRGSRNRRLWWRPRPELVEGRASCYTLSAMFQFDLQLFASRKVRFHAERPRLERAASGVKRFGGQQVCRATSSSVSADEVLSGRRRHDGQGPHDLRRGRRSGQLSPRGTVSISTLSRPANSLAPTLAFEREPRGSLFDFRTLCNSSTKQRSRSKPATAATASSRGAARNTCRKAPRRRRRRTRRRRVSRSHAQRRYAGRFPFQESLSRRFRQRRSQNNKSGKAATIW